MTKSFEVTATGWGWNGQIWYEANPYIGNNAMVNFSFELAEAMSQITISFQCSNTGGDYDGTCYYSLNYPTSGPSSGGTKKSSLKRGLNTITIKQNFSKGQYNLYVWGVGGVWPQAVSNFQGSGEVGAQAYIWGYSDSSKEPFTREISLANTYRWLESVSPDRWRVTTSLGKDGLVVGIDDGPYFHAGCIPIDPLPVACKSVEMSFEIYWNSIGPHNYRWAISTLAPKTDGTSIGPYADTLDEVLEDDQIARGTFRDGSGPSFTIYTHKFTASLAANTKYYLYLWAKGYDNGIKKRYGNFHILGDLTLTFTPTGTATPQWIPYTPWIYNGSRWEPYQPEVYNGSWN